MSPTAKVTYISLSADDPALDAAFEAAIADVRAALGRDYPLHVAGATRAGAAPIESRSPTDARVVVALGAPAAAALVAGNTVVMKPSSETPLAGVKLVEIFEQAGVPAGAISCLPGSGRVVGDGLRDHPHVAGLTFTGSYDVGFGNLYQK